MTHINPDWLHTRIAVAMLELSCCKLQHVLPAAKERPSRCVIDAGLSAVEAFQCALLTRERLDLGRVAVVDGLEEACVEELPVDEERLAEKDGEDDKKEHHSGRQVIVPEGHVQEVGGGKVQHGRRRI